MNRHLKVSLTLAALSLTTVGLLTGCNDATDLEGKVDANQTELQSALRDAIKKAETELNTAKTELQTLVQAGDDANAQELNKKINELSAVIEAAKKVASDADAANKTELLAQIETAKTFAIEAAAQSLQSAKAELEEAIVTGDLATAETMAQHVATLNDAIEIASKLAADSDAALKSELLAAIEAVKKDAADAVSATIDAKTAELKKLCEEGNAAVVAELEEAVTTLGNAIEIAKTFAAESDDAMKEELLEAINASKKEATDAITKSVDSMSAELIAKIDAGDAKSAADLAAALEVINTNLEAVQKVATDADVVLEAQLKEHVADVKAELTSEIKKAVDAAVADLAAKVEAGELKSADDLAKAVADMTAATEAAKVFATDADMAVKAEMEAFVTNALNELSESFLNSYNGFVAEFDAKLSNNAAASAEALAGEVASLNALIESAKTLATEADAANKAELLDAIEAAKKDAVDTVTSALESAVADLTAKVEAGDLKNSNDLTDAMAEMVLLVDAVREAQEAGDEALRNEYKAAIATMETSLMNTFKEALDKAIADFDSKIEAGELATSEAIADAVADLTDAIEAVKKFAVDGDAVLDAKIDEVVAAAKVEMTDAIKTAVDAAVANMTAKLEAGELSAKADLDAAVADLTALVEAAKTVAADADAALEAKIMGVIADAKAEVVSSMEAALDAAVVDLTAKIEAGELSAKADLDAAMADLTALVEAAKTVAADADAALEAKLTEAIADAKAEILESMQTAMDAMVEDFNAKLEAGKLSAKADLEAAVADLTAFIDTAKTIAADADAALEAKLTDAIADAKAEILDSMQAAMDAMVEDFNAKLEAGKLSAKADLEAAVADLTALIEAAKNVAADADAELKADYEALVATTKLEILEAVDGKIADLKAEIESAMAENDATVTGKLSELETMIGAVESAFADADAALKSELETLVADTKSEILDYVTEALGAQKDELLEEIAKGDEANDAKISDVKLLLEQKVSDLNSAIELLKKQDGEFHTKLNDLQAEIRATIAAVDAANMHLQDWNAATDGIVGKDGGLVKLKELFDAYAAKKTTYVDGDFEKVEALYEEYWVRMIRVATVEDIQVVLDEFDALASDVRTIPDVIYDAIMDVGATVDDVEYDADKEGLDNVKYLLDQAVALGNMDVMAHIMSYGEESINLMALYDSYVDQYNALLRKSNGQAIKDRMDALLANPIVWSENQDTTSTYFILQSLRADVDEWLSDSQNVLENVEGFVDTYAQFVEAELRYAALTEAKAEADIINATIERLTGDVTESGATVYNFTNVEALKSRYQLWLTTYFSAPYDVEIGGDTNYAMVDHAAYDELVSLFEQRVEAFKAAASKFANAVDAIGEVNLMSWDEIDVALREYGDLVVSRDLNDFNYLFNETDTPASYYDKLVRMFAEYRTLKTEAHNAYVSAFTPVDGIVVSIYDGAKVQALIDWYEMYGVVDAEGNFTFDNGEAGTGYVLSSDLTVDTAEFEAFVQLVTDYETLVSAKEDEIAEIEAGIADIGTISLNRAEYVRGLYQDYLAFLAGTKVPDGYVADQFKVVDGDLTYMVRDVDTLMAHLETLERLEKEVAEIHKFIGEMQAAVSYTDFADDNAVADYVAQLARAREMIATFIVNNSGSDEGYVTAEEYAKLDAGEFAVVKYEKVAYVQGVTDETEAKLGWQFNLPASDVDYLVGVAEDVKEEAFAAIDASTDEEGIADAIALAESKFEKAVVSAGIYEVYYNALIADVDLDATTKDDLAFRMSLSFETTLNRVVESDNIDDVELNAKFVESELESLYALPQYE